MGKGKKEDNTYQPLLVALLPIQIKQLDSNRLSLQSRPALIINEPFMHRPEPSLSDEIARREMIRDHIKFFEGENMKIGCNNRIREIARRPGITYIRKGEPSSRTLF